MVKTKLVAKSDLSKNRKVIYTNESTPCACLCWVTTSTNIHNARKKSKNKQIRIFLYRAN